MNCTIFQSFLQTMAVTLSVGTSYIKARVSKMTDTCRLWYSGLIRCVRSKQTFPRSVTSHLIHWSRFHVFFRKDFNRIQNCTLAQTRKVTIHVFTALKPSNISWNNIYDHPSIQHSQQISHYSFLFPVIQDGCSSLFHTDSYYTHIYCFSKLLENSRKV